MSWQKYYSWLIIVKTIKSVANSSCVRYNKFKISYGRNSIMSLVPAICTQCGAEIEVDDTHEAGICKYCGTAFITEKAINNYTTNITNHIVNNNNFAGANVTIGNDSNIEGLLTLAKIELQAKHYRSDNLFKYLDEIVAKSYDGLEKIRNLFREMEIYEMAELAIESGEHMNKGFEIAGLLTRYDSENILGWLLKWRGSSLKFYEDGENVIRFADERDKETYQKEVYTYFVEHGPHCNAYKEYLGAIPSDYIKKNRYIQDLLIQHANMLWDIDEQTRNERIKFIRNLLPDDRLNDFKIVRPQSTSGGGCYIATCVYGSYDCPQVWTLRRFRDYILGETWYGRLFIKCYYAISPSLVKLFGETKWFRNFWKSRLDKMVSELNCRGVKDTYYQDKY